LRRTAAGLETDFAMPALKQATWPFTCAVRLCCAVRMLITVKIAQALAREPVISPL
jgi:hypothetical protein